MPISPPATTTGRPVAARDVHLRAGRREDAQATGRIFWEAFSALADRHGFPAEPPSPEFTAAMAAMWLRHPGIHCVIAERDGQVVGSAFVDERATVAGIGPVSVDPGAQDAGIGRALMEALIRRSEDRGVTDIRLVQTAYHYRSLALYAKLGFEVREPLSVVQGPALQQRLPGHAVRPATTDDVEVCAEVSRAVHGFDRTGELRDAVAAQRAAVVTRGGGVTGYATGFGYPAHAVALTTGDLQALIGSASAFTGLGMLVPSRDTALLRWCLDHGLRIVQQSTLMSRGPYRDPCGSWLPSIVF